MWFFLFRKYGGGIGDNENHENLGDDDEIEIPSDDEDNGGSDNNENDDVTLSSTFNINLTVYTMNSSGNYVTGLDQRQEGYTAGGSTTFGNSGGAVFGFLEVMVLLQKENILNQVQLQFHGDKVQWRMLQRTFQ